MEASSLTFDAAKPAEPAADKPCRVPLKKAAVADAHAPSVSVPLRFVITGLVSLLLGVAWLMFRPILLAGYHYSPEVVALTHLLVLGWITSIVMGAMYQLVPVALETRLHSERLVKWQFVFHVAGFIGMVVMFLLWDMKQVGHFGSILAAGVGVFVYNLVRTLRRAPRWNVIATAIASSLAWLTLTVLAGLYLASAKCWPQISLLDPLAQMHAHAHLGVGGVFLLLLLGVSFKLVPMFTLSEVQHPRRAACSIWLVNAGLAGLVVTIALASPWKLLFAMLMIAGLAVYAAELAAILRARKRRSLDWGLKYFLTALGLLAPLSVLGIVLSWPSLPLNEFTTQLENVYGFLALFGVVTFGIVGMLFKIVPFLVWYARYSKEIGRRKVPSLAELYSEPLQGVTYWLYVAGLLATSVAIAVSNQSATRWGFALIAAALAVFAVNMGLILSHLWRPRPEALPDGVPLGGILA
jgi:hypothetical protein